MSTSGRLRMELGVGLKDSIVLYVDAPLLLLEATVFSVAGSLYIPEPVALSACGASQCKVVIRSIKPFLDETLPAHVRQALLLLHERILSAFSVSPSAKRSLTISSAAKRYPLKRSLNACVSNRGRVQRRRIIREVIRGEWIRIRA